MWRFHKSTGAQPLCDTCGAYRDKHGCARPAHLLARPPLVGRVRPPPALATAKQGAAALLHALQRAPAAWVEAPGTTARAELLMRVRLRSATTAARRTRQRGVITRARARSHCVARAVSTGARTAARGPPISSPGRRSLGGCGPPRFGHGRAGCCCPATCPATRAGGMARGAWHHGTR